MPRLGYSIAQAAEFSNVNEDVIVSAIQDRKLIAKRIDGKAVIPRKAIIRWLDGCPDYLVSGLMPDKMRR